MLSNALRIATEKRIARATVKDLLKVGYLVSVNNGEDETEPSRDLEAILKAMMLTDEDRLFAYLPPYTRGDAWRGWIYFVYGNDGWDVVNDYTVNLESALKPSLALADRLGS